MPDQPQRPKKRTLPASLRQRRMLDIPMSEEEHARQRKERSERIIAANKRRLLEALRKTLGNVTLACQACKLDPSTFYKYKKSDEEFAKGVAAADETAIDFVEGHLMKNVKNGSAPCQIFYLKQRARHRGYGDAPPAAGSGSEGLLPSGQGLDLNYLEEEIPEDSLDAIADILMAGRSESVERSKKEGKKKKGKGNG